MRSFILPSLWLAGCAPSEPTRAAEVPPARGTELSQDVEVVPTPAVAPLVVGVARPVPLRGPARAANGKGLRKHAAKDYEASRALFHKALAIDPSHDMARFNLACASSLLGDQAAAAEELKTVLTRDPQRFRQRVREDADLDLLRASPEWAAVDAHLLRAEAGLERAYQRGVPAMFFRHTTPYASWGAAQRGGTKNLVIGLYVHEDRRFVPLGRGGIAAHVDVARKRLFRIESVVREGVVHSMWRSSTISITGLEPDDDLALELDLDQDGPPAVGRPSFWEEAKDQNVGFELSMLLVPTDPGMWLELEWHTLGGQPYSKTTPLEFSSDGLRRTKAPMPAEGVRLAFIYEGVVVVDPPPTGHRVKGRKYYIAGREGPIQLDELHRDATWQSVVVTSDAALAFVTTIEQREGPNFGDTGEGVQRHVVERVNLETGATDVLVAGSGTARTTIGPDGTLYVQSGTKVRRWATPDATESDVLLAGLRLTPPLDRPECNVCG